MVLDMGISSELSIRGPVQRMVVRSSRAANILKAISVGCLFLLKRT